MDVNFYKQNKCPICEGKWKLVLNPLELMDVICTNGCCELIISYDQTETLAIEILLDDYDSEKERFYRLPRNKMKVIKRIEYWKKDFRYLAEILERG